MSAGPLALQVCACSLQSCMRSLTSHARYNLSRSRFKSLHTTSTSRTKPTDLVTICPFCTDSPSACLELPAPFHLESKHGRVALCHKGLRISRLPRKLDMHFRTRMLHPQSTGSVLAFAPEATSATQFGSGPQKGLGSLNLLANCFQHQCIEDP